MTNALTVPTWYIATSLRIWVSIYDTRRSSRRIPVHETIFLPGDLDKAPNVVNEPVGYSVAVYRTRQKYSVERNRHIRIWGE